MTVILDVYDANYNEIAPATVFQFVEEAQEYVEARYGKVNWGDTQIGIKGFLGPDYESATNHFEITGVWNIEARELESSDFRAGE